VSTTSSRFVRNGCGGPRVDIDARPQGNAKDIGADELK